MNPFFRKLYHNPFLRLVALCLALALAVEAWHSLGNPDRGAYKAPALALPQELAAHFAFSPQGNAVAACTDHNQLAITYRNVGPDSRAVVPRSRVFPLPPNALCAPFIWSPEGRHLLMPRVVGSMEGSAASFLLFSLDSSPEVRTLPLPGGVDPNLLPAWSPDGRYLCYVAGMRTVKLGGLWLLDFKAHQARQLVLGVFQSPAFTPTSDRVYFEEDRALLPRAQYDKAMDDWPHVWALGSVAVSGGAPTYRVKWRQGSLMPANDRLIAPMKSGVRYLRYFRSPSGEHLEVWDLPDSGATRLRLKIQMDAGRVNRGVRWSAAGERFAFIDSINAQLPNALKTVDVETGQVRTVIAGPGEPEDRPAGDVIGRQWEDPAISPDGLHLASTRTWVIESESGAPGGNSDEDEDEGPVSVPVASTQKPLLLTLPPVRY